jgi:hypothetical protein
MGDTAKVGRKTRRAQHVVPDEAHFAPVLSRFFEMASSNLTGLPRSIRINFRNMPRKQTRLKTGAVGLRVNSHHWRAEFFALPTVLAASPIPPFAVSPIRPLAPRAS